MDSKDFNLLSFLTSHTLQQDGYINNEDTLFKNKEKRKYFQVKTQIINSDTKVIAILNDITKIKRMEQEQQKMKSMYFASIAHELRTPLNSIMPLTLRLEQMIHDNQILKLIQIIKNSSIFLSNIIEDALDMSRFENNQFILYEEYTNIRKLLEEVLEIMNFQIRQKGLDLRLKISERVPQYIKIDPKRYKQILYNLIGNASKFTFEGYIQLSLDFCNSVLSTKVIDTGIGIKQENIDKLFQFFGQIQNSKKTNKGGMGFGLTISKMILQQMKGEFTVTSEYGKGSTFEFQINIQRIKNNENQISNNQLLYEEEKEFNETKTPLTQSQKEGDLTNSQRLISEPSQYEYQEDLDDVMTFREYLNNMNTFQRTSLGTFISNNNT